MKKAAGGGVLFSIVLAAAAAESITMPEVTPPVITLVQNEPEYHENTVYVGQENTYNIQKFTNPEPLTREADTSSIVSNPTTAHTHTASLPGERLTKSRGVFNGPSGKETWYPSPLGYVVKLMRGLGYDETAYPYWVRGDGVKMFGNYVMVAADTSVRPKGTILETSLGTGIVCDHCKRAETEINLIDIATDW
ncbi:MAG: hypothetical protein IJP92_02785 [Lachnospiraceae bacterium]|nr:hypothetical protein [Lachnospiraceae bacterium]